MLTEGKKHFGSFFNNPEVYAEKIENFVSKVISGQLYLKNKHKIVEEPTEIEDIKGSIEIVDNKKIKDIDKLKGATEIAVAVKDVKLTKQAFK